MASEGYLPIRLTADSDGRFGFSISVSFLDIKALELFHNYFSIVVTEVHIPVGTYVHMYSDLQYVRMFTIGPWACMFVQLCFLFRNWILL